MIHLWDLWRRLAVPTRLLAVSFVALSIIITLLAAWRSGWGWQTLIMSAVAAGMLSIPQTIALAAASASDRIVSGIGWVCAIVSFGLALWVAHDVFTSDSSTAGIALFFFPVINSFIVVGVLRLAILGSRIAR